MSDDELPPCIGERMRDITHDIYRSAQSPETEIEETEQ